MAEEKKQRQVEDWRRRRAACQAGTHSDACPAVTCPVKATWTEQDRAACDQRRQEQGLPPAAVADRWDDYYERAATCRAGNHSDACPDKVCPVKKRWTPEQWAAYRAARNKRISLAGRPFAPGPDDRRPAPGHFAGLAGGGWHSPRVVQPLAQQIKDDLMASEATADYLRSPEWDRAVNSWAFTEAQLVLARARLDELGMGAGETETENENETITGSGKTTRHRVTRKERRESVSRTVDMLEKRAAAARRELGLTPLSRARLGADLAKQNFDLAQFLAERQAQMGSADGGEAAEGSRAIPVDTPLAR